MGAALSDKRFCEILDSDGNNISVKNPNYCELTAIYWIWKNSTADVVGLCHYRRYLGKNYINKKVKILNSDKILRDLNKYDIILPHKYSWGKYSCWQYYILGAGREKDLYLLKKIIQEIEPDYLDAFNKVMDGNRASYCNIMICKKELFDKYAEWLFKILEGVESEIDTDFSSKAEARVYGYMSELLLNVWCIKNKLRIKHYSMINTENTEGIIKEKIRKIKRYF